MADRTWCTWSGRPLWLIVAASLVLVPTDRVLGQVEAPDLHEPVFRVAAERQARLAASAKIDGTSVTPVEAIQPHPLDPALKMAYNSLETIHSIRDYTCTLVKREQIDGTLQDYEFLTCKIRHQRAEDGQFIPFGVYLRFRKPDSVRGREVIYIGGQEGGTLTAHEGGFRGRFLPTVTLDPNSALAMRGNRYPITEIGIQTLAMRLIEKGERDKKLGPCDVRIRRGAKVTGRPCTCLEVRHLDHKPGHDFYMARIFLDDELNLPIRYEAYDWPLRPGAKPPLLEEYSYVDLKLNVGLTDRDFDPENPVYNF